MMFGHKEQEKGGVKTAARGKTDIGVSMRAG
jgi:hypothetical protein